MMKQLLQIAFVGLFWFGTPSKAEAGGRVYELWEKLHASDLVILGAVQEVTKTTVLVKVEKQIKGKIENACFTLNYTNPGPHFELPPAPDFKPGDLWVVFLRKKEENFLMLYDPYQGANQVKAEQVNDYIEVLKALRVVEDKDKEEAYQNALKLLTLKSLLGQKNILELFLMAPEGKVANKKTLLDDTRIWDAVLALGYSKDEMIRTRVVDTIYHEARTRFLDKKLASIKPKVIALLNEISLNDPFFVLKKQPDGQEGSKQAKVYRLREFAQTVLAALNEDEAQMPASN